VRLSEVRAAGLTLRNAARILCEVQRWGSGDDARGSVSTTPRRSANASCPRVLPDSAGNPDGFLPQPHSVVTAHLIDEAGQPTIAARDEILDFFRRRLRS
jgi:hypothetical protein